MDLIVHSCVLTNYTALSTHQGYPQKCQYEEKEFWIRFQQNKWELALHANLLSPCSKKHIDSTYYQ